jgi:hypothetical protein
MLQKYQDSALKIVAPPTTTVISLMLYSTIFWAPPTTLSFQKGLGEKLQRVKNYSLRHVFVAYKATPV